MNKISSKDAAQLLKQAGAAIRHLAHENQDLQTKVASFEHEKRAQAIARSMEEKGLNADLTFEQKVANLMDADLNVTEQAVKLAASQKLGLGHVDDDGPQTSNSTSAFEHYILTGEDPSAE